MQYQVFSIEAYTSASFQALLNSASTQGWTLFDIVPYGFNNVALMLVFNKPTSSGGGTLSLNLGL